MTRQSRTYALAALIVLGLAIAVLSPFWWLGLAIVAAGLISVLMARFDSGLPL